MGSILSSRKKSTSETIVGFITMVNSNCYMPVIWSERAIVVILVMKVNTGSYRDNGDTSSGRNETSSRKTHVARCNSMTSRRQ